jgi:hypothetical protein
LRADVAFGSTAKDDVRIFLNRVSQALVKHLEGAFARVWTLNRLDSMLELQASAGLYTHIDGHHSRIPMGTLKVGKTAQSGVPCLCQDVLNDPDVIDKDWVRREQLRSFVGYPLFVENRLIGIMALYAKQPLPNDAIETCSAIADFVSQGIVRRLARDTIAEQAALLDEAQDAIVVFDLQDRCTYWNRSAERLYGWESGEALGQPPHALILRDKAYFERAKALTQQDGKWIDESEQTTRDGRTLTVESRWTLIHDEKGQSKSILIVNTDVTEKRKVESQFLRTQRMEGIGTLAGGIAHDLNNVLAPILMSVQMLKDKFQDAQSQRMLAILESSAQRGAGMVKQVLTFARGMDGERVLLQTKHLVKEVAKIVSETFPKTIEVRSNIDEALWATMGDATQLHQVLLNLAVNARDAMPNGGSISFSAENTVVEPGQTRLPEGVQPGYYIVIKVTDNGTGIPPEILEKIFEPFFTTKEVGKGTGLGLSTVVGIVKSHGGFLQVQTELNRGTTFLIYLPAQEGAVAATGAGPTVEAASLPTGNGELLLLVDDEPALLTMTREMLEANGYRVVTATDGTEAVAAYTNRSDEIKLVITDMLMPHMDGPTTIRVLRKLNPGLRFVAVSGQMDVERAKEATNTENLLYLMKPYTAEKLLFMVQKGLQPSGPATEAAA